MKNKLTSMFTHASCLVREETAPSLSELNEDLATAASSRDVNFDTV